VILRKSFLFLYCLCVLWASSALALDVPKRPDGYVHDRANLLSPQSRQQLERALANVEAQTSNQILLVTFPSLEDESLEDFSMQLAEAWKPGQKDKDNGIIFLIFKEDRKMRIEVGYGLEGVLPDALAGQIISQQVTPYFKEGRFEEGIVKGLESIFQAIQGEYQGRGTRYGRGRSGYTARPLTPQEARLLFFAITSFVLILFFFDFFRFRNYRGDRKLYNDRYSFWEWWFRFGLLLLVLSILFRVMFYSMLFSRGGYGSRGGFGGGFSGGGGGFGGGGASGGW